MNLITKYKQLTPEDRDNFIMVIAWCMLGVVFIMPFQELITYEPHPVYEFDIHGEYLYGYEHGQPLINLLIMLLVTGFGLMGKSIFSRVMVILFPLIYLPLLGFYYLVASAGAGGPFGNPLVDGFWVMLIADSVITFRSWIAAFRKREPEVPNN